MAEGLEALLLSAQAALSAASASLPSAEQRHAEAAAAESLAVSGAGAVAKTAVGVAGRLRRQWLRWLTEHGWSPTPVATRPLRFRHFEQRRNRNWRFSGLGRGWVN